MKNHDVVIVGGGPTGLMLAGELALARIDVAVVERRRTQELEGTRALGLHARSLEVLDQRGIADRFVAQGKPMKTVSFAIPIDLGDFPTRRHGLALGQAHTERLLAEWVEELGVPIERGREVTGFEEDETGVTVELDGDSLRAGYLVGCDGGRSVVRKTAGIAFPGWDASTSYLIAEVEMGAEPPHGVRHDEKGTYAIGKAEDGRTRLVLREVPPRTTTPSLDEVRQGLIELYGTDFGLRRATWLSRFSDATRQAAAYRKGRVLLAGDAAHIHSPMGGQGLNLGLQDAVNLGWKLAQVVRGTSPVSLLDTYQAERHPVAARALRATMAQTALSRAEPRIDAVREALADLLRMEEPRKHLAGLMSGLDIRYDLGEGHPLLGRRMPDLELDGGQRVFSLLHDARPVLLSFTGPLPSVKVRLVEASYLGPWELPVIGAVPPPAAVLIRPDGHVAWVGDGSDRGLRDALDRWC